MNRQKAIQNLLLIAGIGVSSGTVFKLSLPEEISVNELPHKKLLLAELADTIIPRTDTPGAKDAGVEDFIIKMIRDCTDSKTQHNFLRGLSGLEKYSTDSYGKPFTSCSEAQRTDILKHFESRATYRINIINKINKKLLGVPFFVKLRDLTVEGYCTSMLGATKGMAYDYIPVTFQACIPITPNQKAWATK
ncbi:gluconate 2-dehydrogenase subunit 3 family protein [Mucilaginibacter agri]|uniref:Gluconate 2-dehydrogenase subunit 3 family protein n=1 Tax=Mucilaginibacter agri TaxID=2695265 RepID=A0A965ZHS3_9SPHI|nr:gluconate 2-dehydrogenase subunit 3 family protein [Mucilaginibacter agri]NCD70214.1 gluconate 2-dehydrogenase subunit 3 family protein [Mucilaginibacter agri]